MRIRTLLTLLAFVPTCFLLPAAADSSVAQTPVSVKLEAASPEACLANTKGDHFAQITCCKEHKGVCGCRAGKIVCCDNTASAEPGCACHGDEGMTE